MYSLECHVFHCQPNFPYSYVLLVALSKCYWCNQEGPLLLSQCHQCNVEKSEKGEKTTIYHLLLFLRFNYFSFFVAVFQGAKRVWKGLQVSPLPPWVPGAKLHHVQCNLHWTCKSRLISANWPSDHVLICVSHVQIILRSHFNPFWGEAENGSG